MQDDRHPTGVLLLQLGTPDSTATRDVRRYLREFLSDPRVLDMPAPARALLLNGVILPFRPKRSAEAYRKIWTDHGSPLVTHTRTLAERVQSHLGDGFRVTFGMRYRKPSIESALDELAAAGCHRIVALPLFPQYASASGGSAIQRVFEVAGARWNVPPIHALGDFHDHPGYLRSVADRARPLLEEFAPDHILFSYHGLPEKQVMKSGRPGWCLTEPTCCDAVTAVNRYCYRAQCFATTRGVARELGLDPARYSTTFQSRLAGQKWIEPYTDRTLPGLHARGVRRLVVLTPSFVADCLETLEEIGIRGRNQWEELGGEDLLLVPCLNADWAETVVEMVEAAL
jgi:ferrochelatase